MNELLVEIYSTIIPSAPYIIAAYVLVMVVLFVFIGITFAKLRNTERKLDLLETELKSRQP